MTKYTLRPYQQKASDAGVAYFLDKKRKHGAVIVAATGCGKSLIIADIAARLNDNVLVFCPSKEILQQNHAKMLSYGLPCAMYSASVGQKEIAQVTFVTIGSVKEEAKLFKQFKYIMIDECHLVNPKGGMYKRFLSQLKGSKVLGLTATPYRLETFAQVNDNGYFVDSTSRLMMLTSYKRAIFKEVLYVIEAAELLRQGYLCPLEYFYLPCSGWNEQDLFKNTSGSDYSDQSVKSMNIRTGFDFHLISVVRRLMNPKSGIKRNGILVFTRFVEDAKMVADNIEDAAYLSGAMTKKERERILRGFAEGTIKVLANAGVLIVGYDRPDLDTVVLATPTLSLARYYQEIGRILRTSSQKDKGWVVDLCGNINRFGEVSALNMKQYHGYWNVYSGDKKLTNVDL